MSGDGGDGAPRRSARAATARFLESIWYGAGASRRPFAAASLRPLALLYCAASSLRAALYARGLKRRVELAVPVVVVGNISVGGTGKTPLLIWLAARLVERGYAPGIVARGYGGASRRWPRLVTADSDPREVGDEPVLLARRTGRPVAVAPDRARAGQALLAAAPEVDVVLADDGLQHYRLARAVEIAVVDGGRGLGNGLCLPAGPLRERPERLARVDAVVANGAGWGGADAIRGELVPTRVYALRGGEAPRSLEDFAGRSVHAVAGIGHPERFFAMLERAGIRVVRHPLPDHAAIAGADLEHGPGPVLLTEKDAVKCRSFAPANVWCVEAQMRFAPAAADALLERVSRRLPPPRGRGVRR